MTELLKLIKAGESKTLELKERLPNGDGIAKTVIAFANTSGGRLVIGVDDKLEIIGFDEEVCYEQNFDQLDLSPLTTRFKAIGKKINTEKLINLKLVKEERGKLYPSQALMILLGQYEHIRIKCARFKGNTMEEFLDRKEYSGDLFQQLDSAETFIKNHLHLRGKIRGLQRTDTLEIPEEALREAIINAIIHRDYTNHGRDIKIGIYDDTVNIVSPGSFPSSLSLEDLQEGRSEIRSQSLGLQA